MWRERRPEDNKEFLVGFLMADRERRGEMVIGNSGTWNGIGSSICENSPQRLHRVWDLL